MTMSATKTGVHGVGFTAVPRRMVIVSALATLALAACGQAAAVRAGQDGGSTTTTPGFVPPPPEYVASGEVARTFVQRAMNGEDVSDMVADYTVNQQGFHEPSPENPARVAALASRQLGAQGTAEPAPVHSDDFGLDQAGFRGAENCVVAGDFHLSCTIFLRTAFGDGKVNVDMFLPERSGRTPVDSFEILVPVLSFTG